MKKFSNLQRSFVVVIVVLLLYCFFHFILWGAIMLWLSFYIFFLGQNILQGEGKFTTIAVILLVIISAGFTYGILHSHLSEQTLGILGGLLLLLQGGAQLSKDIRTHKVVMILATLSMATIWYLIPASRIYFWYGAVCMIVIFLLGVIYSAGEACLCPFQKQRVSLFELLLQIAEALFFLVIAIGFLIWGFGFSWWMSTIAFLLGVVTFLVAFYREKRQLSREKNGN